MRAQARRSRPPADRPAIFDLRPVGPADGVTLLTGYLILLMAVPSDLVVGSLGGAGSPAAMYALAMALWWCWSALQHLPHAGPARRQPLRVAVLAVGLCVLASYAMAMSRPISDVEASAALLSVLKVAGMIGLVLVVGDGILSADRFLDLVRRLVLAGGLFAALGLFQFITGRSWVDQLSVPGLVATQTYSNIVERGGFIRAASTAMQPLEYGLVLAMVLPLALTLALWDDERPLLRRWWPVMALIGAAGVSLSRSALIGVAVGVLILIPSWPRRIRGAALFAAVLLAVGVYVLVPGMAGTIKGLFTGLSGDSSAVSRSSSYAVAAEFVHRSPLFGRGLGTFLPDYRIFDNQYLQLIVEVGVIGLVAFLGLSVTAVVCAGRLARNGIDPLLRAIGYGLASSVVAGTVLMAFFDGFSFPKAIGTEFLVIGIAGAAWRMTSSTHTGRHPPGETPERAGGGS